MRKSLLPILFNLSLLMLTTFIASAAENMMAPEKGVVKGRVTDAQGKAISNVKVVIENTVFFASYFYATTDANGYYRTTIKTGSWKASVRIIQPYLGIPYQFDLHPDNPDAFAGTSGTIRNFTWKLTGAKPDGVGYYGSDVAVYTQPGSALLLGEVEITLTPEGKLVDGNAGKAITKSLTDIGGGEDGISDVPIGKYFITAKNKKTGSPLQVRLRNKGAFADKLTATFTSGFTGVTSYKIVVQVQDKDEQ
ncbi:MAG: carboxypeptidase regulatory-like domain-containing protein [Chitinophagaceae bacterium]|nr:MAG: carboxypeptidase regulatory-like domain-containing protein [Chitinophagaceae bacterium]